MQDLKTHTDTLAIDKLNEEAWALNRKDPVKAIELSEQALKNASAQNYITGKALALKTLGAANVWISKNEEAMQYSFEAVELFATLGDKRNEAETNYNIGANFRYISDYDSAVKYYNRCYQISKEIGDEVGMADGLNGLGTVYYGINENHKALEVLLESQNLCLKPSYFPLITVEKPVKPPKW
jgi:tetratricopeptide (TPR) repeat protein